MKTNRLMDPASNSVSGMPQAAEEEILSSCMAVALLKRSSSSFHRRGREAVPHFSTRRPLFTARWLAASRRMNSQTLYKKAKVEEKQLTNRRDKERREERHRDAHAAPASKGGNPAPCIHWRRRESRALEKSNRSCKRPEGAPWPKGETPHLGPTRPHRGAAAHSSVIDSFFSIPIRREDQFRIRPLQGH